MVKAIPDGYHSITPYMVVDDCARAIEFYTNVLGAKEIMRMEGEGRKIGHAEIKFGDSHVMLADEHAQRNIKSAKAYGGSPLNLMLYVENVDELVNKAVAAGATLQMPVQNQFYGDRSGQILDPFGYSWTIATHVEDVPPQEMEKRAAEWMKQNSSPAAG